MTDTDVLSIRLRPADNVVVARFDLAPGTSLPSENMVTRAAIPVGHKVATAAIKAGQPPAGLAADEQMVYDVAWQLVEDRRLDETLYRRAVALLGAKALVELVGTMGYYTLASMTLNAFEVELPEGEDPPFPMGE